MKKIYLSLTVTILIIIVAVGLYWYFFHNGLFCNSADWGNFGNYFNGISTPLLTIVNILVFIGISMKLSAMDDKRAEKETKGRKDLMLMQFRKKEIDNFERTLNEAFIPSSQFVISKDSLARPIVFADLYLHTFLKSKLNLFDLTDSSEITASIKELKRELNNYYAKFVENEVFIKNDLLRLLELQSSIIKHLQMTTIDTVNM